MKEALKKVFYFLFKIFTAGKSTKFSSFLINWGYMIKSEAMYNRSKVPAIIDRIPMHEMVSTQVIKPQDEILFLEFGVYRGDTFKIWIKNNKNTKSIFAGFDTFVGLPEDWGSEKKGSYSAQGKLPDITDSRVSFLVGLIQDTLPDYIKLINKDAKKIIHIDVDLYNASMITLIYLQPYLKTGDIIIFDDFFTFTKAEHEFKALLDYISLYKLAFKPLMKCRRGQYVIEIQ